MKGLSSTEAAVRLAAEGPNALPVPGRHGLAAIALGVLREPMFLLLLAATGIYLVLGDVHEAMVLGASIVGVIAVTVTQERKAERALEALRDLSSPRAMVLRDGEKQRIAGRDVVRGDLLILAEGDRVPADARLLEATDLTVDESLLTGESLPVDKRAGDAVFSGTLLVRGQGRAEVVATGSRSEFGRIGASLATLDPGKTSLERETARIVRLVAAFAVALSLALVGFFGLTRGDWLGGALGGLTLAMSILPEEFPVVLTVFLALGAWRISQHGVLTRRMPAIEMLGAATVLCVDKTGTLTENRMAVVDTPQAVVDIAALACEVDLFDPMEKAIVAKAGADARRTRDAWHLERDYPFSDDFLAVCHAWRSPQGELRIAIKGAPETVLPLCGRRDAMAEVERASESGLRLLAVAEAQSAGPLPDDPRRYAFRFAGFVRLADPLRASVPDAVAQCRRAGIRVVMITGDFPGTALNIARQAGLDAGEALSGDEVAALDDAALAAAVRRVNVFARVRPEQKLRLVQAYRAAGEVVAMTGDGVNDAPALKAAHIGIAMGSRGTDVAREAAALVLLEDDFGSIVRTVRLGRRIYENIRNAMRYLVSVHVPIAGMAFLPVALGGPLFLYPVHVVFLEFVIDPACTLVYEAERTEAGAMERPPRAPLEPLFNLRMLAASIVLGLTMLGAVFAAYWWTLDSGRSEAAARTIAFAAIVLSNLALLFATRSRTRTVLATLREPNAALWWITIGALAALAAAIYVPAAAAIFQFSPLGAAELAVAAAAGVAGVAWYDLAKLARQPGGGPPSATMPA
ncbi:MAG: cation-translocating P-type ATPase [Betaproteobacteria bacterium]|nr:cation-translocating P-type ATPase [Betaproteobacteria bacterium]MDH5350110.1 cation-translocating P-type ATPase [Betaproteobacteria bacterium]